MEECNENMGEYKPICICCGKECTELTHRKKSYTCPHCHRSQYIGYKDGFYTISRYFKDDEEGYVFEHNIRPYADGYEFRYYKTEIISNNVRCIYVKIPLKEGFVYFIDKERIKKCFNLLANMIENSLALTSYDEMCHYDFIGILTKPPIPVENQKVHTEILCPYCGVCSHVEDVFDTLGLVDLDDRKYHCYNCSNDSYIDKYEGGYKTFKIRLIAFGELYSTISESSIRHGVKFYVKFKGYDRVSYPIKGIEPLIKGNYVQMVKDLSEVLLEEIKSDIRILTNKLEYLDTPNEIKKVEK